MVNVSAIIPVFNAEKFIESAIKSVFAQEIENLELIIVNDGSTDRTIEKAMNFPDVKIYNQPNLGIPYARNRGLRESNGRYISFLDADDRWVEGKLKKQLAVFKSNPEIEIVDGLRRNILDDGVVMPPWLHERSFSSEGIATFGLTEALFKREVFSKVGLFNEEFMQQQDVEWYVRARDLGVRIEVLPEVVLLRRIHGNNMTYQRANSNHLLCRILADSIKRKRIQIKS